MIFLFLKNGSRMMKTNLPCENLFDIYDSVGVPYNARLNDNRVSGIVFDADDELFTKYDLGLRILASDYISDVNTFLQRIKNARNGFALTNPKFETYLKQVLEETSICGANALSSEVFRRIDRNFDI